MSCQGGRRRVTEATLFWHFGHELGDQPHDSLAFAPRAAWSPVQASAIEVPHGATEGDSLTLQSSDAPGDDLPHFWEAPTSGAPFQRALLRREAVPDQDCGELAERQGVVELSEETDDPITGFGDASQPEAMSRGVMVGVTLHAGGLFSPAFISVEVKMCVLRRVSRARQHPLLPSGTCSMEQARVVVPAGQRAQSCVQQSLAWFKEQEVNLLGWRPVPPDLNPLDNSVWSTIEARVQRQTPTTVDHLRWLIVWAFDEFSSADAGRVVGHYVKRLRACVAAGGSWFYPVEPSSLAVKVMCTQQWKQTFGDAASLVQVFFVSTTLLWGNRRQSGETGASKI